MPEGDTVWRTAQRLSAALTGRVLTVTDLRWASLATADLRDHTTIGVVPRGKHLLQRVTGPLGAWTVHSHLRMEGSWRVGSPGSLPTRAHDVRAVLETAETMAVGRRLGMLDLVRTADEHRLVGHLGPDVLGPDWDLEQAVANVRSGGQTIAAALLDQRNLAGLGTVWTCEPLFLERLNPWTPAAEVPEATVTRLLARTQRMMQANLPYDTHSSTGSHVKGQSTYVHGRSGLDCRRCGETVRVWLDGPAAQERTIFHCPRCQGAAPGDDGRPQAPLGSSRRSPRRARYRP